MSAGGNTKRLSILRSVKRPYSDFILYSFGEADVKELNQIGENESEREMKKVRHVTPHRNKLIINIIG